MLELMDTRFSPRFSFPNASHSARNITHFPGQLLFFDTLNTLPLAPQILLPQANLIIPLTNSQHIPTQAPTNPPQHGLELQLLALPLAPRHARPDTHCLVLARAGDVALLQHRRRPRHIAHPIRVPRQRCALGLVLLRCAVERPDPQQVVGAACYEAP